MTALTSLEELKFTLKSHKARLMERFGKCAYCDSRENLTLDHIVPKSRQGLNHPTNLVLACQYCNCKKGDKNIHQWLHLTGQSLVDVLSQRIID